MATEHSINVWDPGLSYKDVTKAQGCSFRETDYIDDISFKISRVNPHYTHERNTLSELILKYKDIWRNLKTPFFPIRRYELERCEEELMEKSVRLDFFNIPLESFEDKESITMLLHIYHVFSVPGQEEKKSWVIKQLTVQLAKKSEYDLYKIYNEYIDQLNTRCSLVTDKNLCIREINPYYELQLKLCYSETIMKQDNIQHKYFMLRNVEFVMSRIKDMITRKEYKTMSKSCSFLLHVISKSVTLCHQPGRSQNQEELMCLLTDSLSMLPQVNFNGIFQVYLKENSMLDLEKLCASLGKADGYVKLNIILVYCENLIKQKHNQLYRKWMVQNLKLFIDLKIKVVNSDSIKIISNGCDKSRNQMKKLWKNEGYRIRKLLGLLSRLLCMLPDDELYETISHYLFLVKNMKSDITPDYLHSVKADPGLKKLFKLFWWRKLITEGHADSNIVNRYINYFCSGKWLDNKAECMAHIIIITDNLPEKSFTKELLQGFLKRNIQTVTSMQTRCDDGLEWNAAHAMSKRDLMYTQCASILSGKKMKNVDIKQYSKKLNMKGPEDENESETQSEQVKLLILFILLLLVTALGHKSAKLKKYLALKYEYDMASLYLLWCSGDIEVHPGPLRRQKQLDYDSEIERKWLQDINSILLKLYWRKPIHSKPRNLWQNDNRPKQWPSDKPFYDTKNSSKDAKGNKISEVEMLTCLMECLMKKNVDIPQIYQSEISEWKNRNIQLLHKLQVFRNEMEKVNTASINLLLSNLEDDVKNLQNIKVCLENSTLDEMQIKGLLNKDLRQKKQAEIVAEITRDLANTLCRLAKGIDPMEKGDGTWNMPPPVDWPEDVPFFNPKNRGKNKDKPKCPDTVLVCTFLKLQYLRIPENLQQVVDAYQTMYNCTDTDVKKKNKDELCRLYTVQSNLEKLDCSLHNLHKEGLFSREVHGILNQWWNTKSVDEHAEHVLKNALVRSDERPHITIDITIKNEQDTDLRYISYTIPIKDAYLHIKCTTDHPNQSNLQQTITKPLVQANSPENIEDSVLPPDVLDLVLDHDVVDETECPNDNSVTDNIPMLFDLQRQGTPLPITHQHLKPQNDLDTLTTDNTLASDLNGSRCTTEYDATMIKACDSVHSSNSRNCENLGGNMITSKRKQIEDKEEPVKKLLKTKVNQIGHYNSTDKEISSPESKNDGGSQEPNHIRSSNRHDICSANVQDLPSLEFSLSDIIDGIGDQCNSKPSKDSVTFQQICDLESMNNSNQQDSHENINELNHIDNQMMDQTDDKTELEKCLEMIQYLSR